MSRLRCAEVLPHMESHRRGDASSELSLLVEDHLARCPDCRRRMAHLKQVSAMLTAWRPQRVPDELLVETADAVGEGLGELGRHVFGRRRKPAERSRRQGPPLGRVQRLANALALAALLFLGGALVYRIWFDPTVNVPAAPKGSYSVRLIRWDSPLEPELPGEAFADLIAAQKQQFIADLARAAELTTDEAEALLERTPVTIRKDLTRGTANSIAERLRAFGGRVEVLGGAEPRPEPQKAPDSPPAGPSASP